MSFFTFHISMFFSASLAWEALIVSEGDDYGRSGSRFCRAVVWYPKFFESFVRNFRGWLGVSKFEKPQSGIFFYLNFLLF